MIKDVILPSHIGNYFIFSERIVGVDIGKSSIAATVVRASGSSVALESCLNETLTSNKKSYDERVVDGLQSLFGGIGSYSQIRTSLSSSHVIYKTLRLPFATAHKIRMVLHFEVAPLLPFAIQDAVIDFIITRHYPEEESTEIMVAAVQKQHIAHHLSLFTQAGLDPSIITVDMFALYALYNQIPAYSSEQGTQILADLGMQSTRLAAIHDGTLITIRSLPQGLSSIAKQISAQTKEPTQQSLEQIIRFGLGHSDPVFQQTLKEALTQFWNKVQFALSSLSVSDIHHLYLLGSGAEINGITRFVKDASGISCDLFDASRIKENSRFSMRGMQTIPHSAIISTAAALPSELMQSFNLRGAEYTPQQHNLFAKQLIVALILAISCISVLMIHLINQRALLRKEIALSENETIEMLKQRFPSIDEDEDDLDELKTTAENELKQEEATWFAFTRSSRVSFLEYLLELTSKINKQQLGFIPEQITITDGPEGQIILKARVRDFEALKQLEQALRDSKLFTFVEGQTSPHFTMKIVVGPKKGG